MSIGNPPPGDDRTPTDERPTVGRVLAQARREAGLTIDEVSGSTRVRVPIVHAIEQDDYSRCGGDFYARGHIRLIARAVGSDPDALVAQYDAEHGSPAPTPASQMFEAERLRPERRRPNWTAAMVAAIAVVIAFVGFNLFSGGSKDSGDQAGQPSAPASAKPSTGTQSHQGQPGGQPKKPDPKDSAIAAVPADKVTVKITAEEDKSWISAVNGTGQTLFQSVLEKGASKTFTDDKQIKLVVGNAGAVKMFVNGKDLGPAGDQGEVVRLNFTPGDPQAG
ncbi:helix-turn-helix domain-containing protein [Wenjunlia tyrosinilytica]|uniref:Membrane protein n=1 Tax=Wenjunlia tyrosinilytica TaxID=1544741 RepID=A0A917ZTY0_9ACTN|nr:helix-turn-helix domain-containing protein [Wenjunlia tyrosinilytica]GGO91585.1 membrane protein [Wenjunlia tyrosinilytica]